MSVDNRVPENDGKGKKIAIPELLEKVKSRAQRISEEATEISRRIEQFEKWLAALPGRVQTELWVDDPDSDQSSPSAFGLMLHRYGKEWLLSVGYEYQNHLNDGVEWKPLRDASVDEKIFSVSLFPQFIKKLGSSQLKLISRLEEANAQFDELASAIGIEKKEGA